MWWRSLFVACFVICLIASPCRADLDVTTEVNVIAEQPSGAESNFHRVTADEDGLLVSCGAFDDQLTFDGVDAPVVVAGAFGPGPNLMCVRFDENGAALWAVPLSSYEAVEDFPYGPYGISSVTTVVLGEDDSVFVTGSFQGHLYLPCGERGSTELCTATVPSGEGEVPAVMLIDTQASFVAPFYAKLGLEDGGAIWAFRTAANATHIGDAVADESSLFISGSAAAWLANNVTVPVVPDGVDVASVSFNCSLCSFTCAISPVTGGAVWCKTFPGFFSNLALGDGGAALYIAGEVGDLGPGMNRTGLRLVKLDVEEEGDVLWVAEKEDHSVDMWMPGGLSCYNDCQTIYYFGSYQLNLTVDITGAFNGFVWAVDEAGNEQWLSTISDDDHMYTLVVATESANGLYVAGNWFDEDSKAFIMTLDYSDGQVLQSSELEIDIFVDDATLVGFSLESATFGLCGATVGATAAAEVAKMIVVPGMDPVYPSASASPVPSPSLLPSPSAIVEQTVLYSSLEDDNHDDVDDGGGGDDDDDWIWWVIGILAVGGIVVALVVVVVGGVIYRRRMLVQQAQEDPYDYDMLSKDMFDD